MSVIELIRQAAARRAAIFAYAQWHDDFSTEEQTLTHEGDDSEAARLHGIALILLRAYRAEMDDPPVFPMDPREGQWG